MSCFHAVSPIIGMKEPFHYRNKVQAAFGRTRRGEIISGIYQSSTHKIVKTDSCFIENKKADEIINTVRALKEIYPKNTEFYLIIGGDMLFYFEHWYRYEALLKECHVVAAARENDSYTDLYEYANQLGRVKVLLNWTTWLTSGNGTM